uniref:Ig-like domain-containing protein n=1 Tax=Lates calcarifer TaxID=8187 RepID=A0A4W6EZD5_LATCA
MGMLDGRMIDYFDSDNPKKVPKEKWMKENLQPDYWEKGTQSRQSKQQWFKVNIGILKERMRQNDSDIHVLQWMTGCEGDVLSDGNLMFHRGLYMLSYDGNDFLSFDDANSVWVAPTDEAVQTKRKWDNDQDLKDKTKGYVEHECIQWLNKFMMYEEQQLKSAPKPKVYLFAKDSKVKANTILTCLATGFYPKDIILKIKRGDRVLTREDGLVTSGVRPNGDDTYQRRDSVEILKTDKSEYTCGFIHEASGVWIEKVWDHTLHEASLSRPFIGALSGVLVVVGLVAVVLIVLWRLGYIGRYKIQ